MIRQHLLIVATGVALVGLAVAAPTPYRAATAQSGQALVFAERACLDYGVTPSTAAYESCVKRAARAFDRGEPDVAYMQARSTRDARDRCLADGLPPDTLGYKQCVTTQVERRTSGARLTYYRPRPVEQPLPPTQR